MKSHSTLLRHIEIKLKNKFEWILHIKQELKTGETSQRNTKKEQAMPFKRERVDYDCEMELEEDSLSNDERSRSTNAISSSIQEANKTSIRNQIINKLDKTNLSILNDSNLNSIESFFNHLIDEKVLSQICKWTNEVHDMKLTIDEFQCFIGLLLMFGVLKKNDVDLSEIWCENSLQYIPQAKAAMSQHRFQDILRQITFNDPKLSKKLENNKKIEKIFHLFNVNDKEFIVPDENKSSNLNEPRAQSIRHLISRFTCRRGTNRWTIKSFFHILDIAASSSLIYFEMKNNLNSETLTLNQRRKHLERLVLNLVSKQIESRAQKLGATNFVGVKLDVQESFKRALQVSDLSSFKNNSPKTELTQLPRPKSRRCEFCHHLPQNKLAAVKTLCETCRKFCCKNHSKIFTNIVCLTCFSQSA